MTPTHDDLCNPYSRPLQRGGRGLAAIYGFSFLPVHIGQCIEVGDDVGEKVLPAFDTHIAFFRDRQVYPGHEEVSVDASAVVCCFVPDVAVSQDQGQFPLCHVYRFEGLPGNGAFYISFSRAFDAEVDVSGVREFFLQCRDEAFRHALGEAGVYIAETEYAVIPFETDHGQVDLFLPSSCFPVYF